MEDAYPEGAQAVTAQAVTHTAKELRDTRLPAGGRRCGPTLSVERAGKRKRGEEVDGAPDLKSVVLTTCAISC